jgi:energy-coupling factor transporter transmembrane protein EcfT
MNITSIDRVATSRGGVLHRARLWVKLLGYGAVLAAVLFVQNAWVLGGLAVLLVVVVLLARLPLKLFFELAAYPLVFGALIALTAELATAARITLLLRSVCAGSASIILILTTPYPVLFAAVGRVTPRLLGDTLLMTYRAFFILAARMDALLRALRLRGALTWRRPLVSLRALANATGNLVLYSIDLAERDYDILTLRGYDGSLRITATTAGRDLGNTPRTHPNSSGSLGAVRSSARTTGKEPHHD